jgi:pimeloyl-ACP methyl ester carboxylesterase
MEKEEKEEDRRKREREDWKDVSFVHLSPICRNTLAPLFLHLCPTPVTFLAIDFAGHGLSGHKPSNSYYSTHIHALDVLSLADSLNWDEFYLIGHSMGFSHSF